MVLYYPTASTCAVFINGIHVEQSFRLDYKESMPRTPIFGYNDYYFSKAAIGKNLIQGVLIVNFTVPFYLNFVLEQQEEAFVPKLYNYDIKTNKQSAANNYIKNVNSLLMSELPSNSTEDSKKARAEFIATLISGPDTKIRAETERAVYEMFDASIIEEDRSTVFSPVPLKQVSLDSPLTVNQLTDNGILLDVYYSDPSNSAWFTRFYNVHFFDISQQANQAGAEGSSEPLYEIYSFIAQKRETRLIRQNG